MAHMKILGWVALIGLAFAVVDYFLIRKDHRLGDVTSGTMQLCFMFFFVLLTSFGIWHYIFSQFTVDTYEFEFFHLAMLGGLIFSICYSVKYILMIKKALKDYNRDKS
jgi:hypothetical protein